MYSNIISPLTQLPPRCPRQVLLSNPVRRRWRPTPGARQPPPLLYPTKYDVQVATTLSENPHHIAQSHPPNAPKIQSTSAQSHGLHSRTAEDRLARHPP